MNGTSACVAIAVDPQTFILAVMLGCAMGVFLLDTLNDVTRWLISRLSASKERKP